MLSFHFAFSLLSSALVSSALSYSTVADSLKTMKLELPRQIFPDLSVWKIAPEVPNLSFSLFAKKSPAPMEAEILRDIGQDPVDVDVNDESGISPAPQSEDLYSYVYETEEYVESPKSLDLIPEAGDYLSAFYTGPYGEQYPFDVPQAESEATSAKVDQPRMVDGALKILEDSTAGLSVVFRNISVRISHIRKTF
jgi:hypothetical protein